MPRFFIERRGFSVPRDALRRPFLLEWSHAPFFFEWIGVLMLVCVQSMTHTGDEGEPF